MEPIDPRSGPRYTTGGAYNRLNTNESKRRSVSDFTARSQKRSCRVETCTRKSSCCRAPCATTHYFFTGRQVIRRTRSPRSVAVLQKKTWSTRTLSASAHPFSASVQCSVHRFWHLEHVQKTVVMRGIETMSPPATPATLLHRSPPFPLAFGVVRTYVECKHTCHRFVCATSLLLFAIHIATSAPTTLYGRVVLGGVDHVVLLLHDLVKPNTTLYAFILDVLDNCVTRQPFVCHKNQCGSFLLKGRIHSDVVHDFLSFVHVHGTGSTDCMDCRLDVEHPLPLRHTLRQHSQHPSAIAYGYAIERDKLHQSVQSGYRQLSSEYNMSILILYDTGRGSFWFWCCTA